MLRLRQDIPLFPGGRKKAFTLSSDDGVTQDIRLCALMRKYGIKGTFHLNSGLMGDRDWLIQPGINASHYKLKKEEIRDTYDGFEIAVHTMTHPDLTRVPSAMAAYEIAANKKELEEIICRPVQGMSYPFGTYDDEVVNIARGCGIIYSRTIETTDDFYLPDDFLKWHPTGHYCDNKRFSAAQRFLKPVTDQEYRHPLLFYVWGHAYQLDAYNDWDSIEDFFRLIGRQDEIWYASNIEICTYMNAVKQLVYSSSGDYIFNPSCMDVWMMIDRKTICLKSGKTTVIPWQHTDDSTQSKG